VLPGHAWPRRCHLDAAGASCASGIPGSRLAARTHLGRRATPRRRTANRVLDLQSRYDAAVSVVRGSLAGIYARNQAPRQPHPRAQIITLGSHSPRPRKAVPRRSCLRPLRAHCIVVPRELPAGVRRRALPVPATSIYSRKKKKIHGIVCLAGLPSTRPSARARTSPVVRPATSASATTPR